MVRLTPEIHQKLGELASRYEVSEDAALAALEAISEGGGRMAQFHQPELGGGVQWMRGGMIMIGDAYNNALKARVDGLCSELSDLVLERPREPAAGLASRPYPSEQGESGASGSAPAQGVSFSTESASWGGQERWWPDELGSPSATGSADGLAYALFADRHRLAIRFRGIVRVYDTLDHRITGIAQQQSGHGSLTFTSQKGTVHVDELPLMEERGE